MSLQMIFNQNELDMTKGLADAFIQILTSKYNYTYSEKFKDKTYKFVIDKVWQLKKKERGGEITEQKFDKFVDSLFHQLLTDEKSFLNEFNEFNIDTFNGEAIIRPIKTNQSKYLS